MKALKWLLPVAAIGFLGGILASVDLGSLVERDDDAKRPSIGHAAPQGYDADAESGPGYYDPETEGQTRSEPSPENASEPSGEDDDDRLPTWLFTPQDSAEDTRDVYAPTTAPANRANAATATPADSPRGQAASDAAQRALDAARAVQDAENSDQP